MAGNIAALETEIASFRDAFVPTNQDDVPVGNEETGEDAQASEAVE